MFKTLLTSFKKVSKGPHLIFKHLLYHFDIKLLMFFTGIDSFFKVRQQKMLENKKKRIIDIFSVFSAC